MNHFLFKTLSIFFAAALIVSCGDSKKEEEFK